MHFCSNFDPSFIAWWFLTVHCAQPTPMLTLIRPSRPGRGLLLPCFFLSVLCLLLWWLSANWVATVPPPEVAIELNEDQLSALADAYEHGISNPEPDDPCKRIKMLSGKQLSKWRRQFSRRGFTVAKVRELLRGGARSPHTHPTKGTTYTKITGPAGNWIIVDFVDCILWQVAPHNFKS